VSGTNSTSGSADRSWKADEYSVSTLARTTSLNDASGNSRTWANWATGAAKASGLATLVIFSRAMSMITSGRP